MKRNTYRASVVNYNTQEHRTFTIKAPNKEAAHKLANIKVHYPEAIQYIKDVNDSTPNDRENREHCKRIALDLEDYANGLVYRCPECNDVLTVPSDWSGEKYKCSNCGSIHEEHDMNPQTLWDYFENDIYDIEYRIGTGKEYRSVRVMVACGGPNIYIDTAAREVQLYWWMDKAFYPIDRDTCEEIDNYFEELFECL